MIDLRKALNIIMAIAAAWVVIFPIIRNAIH
jgi:hypothetical protein